MTLKINFRLLSGLRFTLKLSPFLTIGQIRSAIASNDIFPGSEVKILYNQKYLKDSDVIGNIGIKRNEFLLCHPPVKLSKDHKKNQNQDQNAAAEQPAQHQEEPAHQQGSEPNQNLNILEEMGFTNEQALVALQLADGNTQSAAELLFRYRMTHPNERNASVGVQIGEEAVNPHDDSNIHILNHVVLHVAEPSLTRNIPLQQTIGQLRASEQRPQEEQPQRNVAHDEEQPHSQEERLQQNEIHNEEHQDSQQNEVHNEEQHEPVRNQLQVTNEYMDRSERQNAPNHIVINRESPNLRRQRPSLEIQSTLSVQREFIQPAEEANDVQEEGEEVQPEMHHQDVQASPEQLEQIPSAQEPNEESHHEEERHEGESQFSIVQVIRDDPSLFPVVLCTINSFDRDFAQTIRENPETFLIKCGLDPSLYNCEEVRFIPPEFRFLTSDIRKNMKSVISKDKQNGLKSIVKLLKDAGNNLDLPVTRNPEGFIRSLGLEPSDYNLDEVRSCPMPAIEEVLGLLTEPEKKELIHLTRIGFSVATVMEEFQKCNHNPDQARRNLISL